MVNGSCSRRNWLKASAAVATAGIAGCVGGGGEGGDEGSVVIWQDDWDTDEFQEWLRSEIENDEISIQFTDQRYDDIHTEYLTAAQGGTPDVVEGTPVMLGDFYTAEIAEPLTDRIEEEDHFDGYTDTAIEAMTHDGEIWGLPYTGNGRGMVYREDIFEEYGWEEFPDDWDEWLELGAEISAGEDDINAFIVTTQRGNARAMQEFLSMLFQRVDDIFVEEGDEWVLDVSAEDLGIVLEKYFWDPFHATDPPLVDPETRGIDSLDADLHYWNQKCAVRQAGSFIADSAQDAGETGEETLDVTGVAHNPIIDGGERDTLIEVKPVFVNPHSADVDTAYEIAKIATSPEGITKHHEINPGNLPPHTDSEWPAPEEVSPAWAAWEDIFDSGRMFGFWNFSAPESEFHSIVQNVIYDEIDPMKAGEDLHEAWQDVSHN